MGDNVPDRPRAAVTVGSFPVSHDGCSERLSCSGRFRLSLVAKAPCERVRRNKLLKRHSAYFTGLCRGGEVVCVGSSRTGCSDVDRLRLGRPRKWLRVLASAGQGAGPNNVRK